MNSSDIVQLSRLLDEGMVLDATERETWLAGLPAEQRYLLPALREMLASYDGPSAGADLLTLPRLGDTGNANDTSADDGAAAHAGERVGAYRLLREIGRGGMGSVWLAERADGSFERQIALKLPRLAWMEGLASRMARERRIGALLEHPNIARLYDAGVDEQGRPYIAMAFIDGQTIDVWCNEHGLDVKARLKLYLQVVRAVAYAHGRLVIHRDLKPANVMVDAQGQAHLLDFGIAKLLDDVAPGVDLTQEQGRMLTPSYASPEQIAGLPVGVAADVYSLGVMLYELLTGVLPLLPKRRTRGAMEEAILQGDAPLASSRVKDPATARALRREVDAILGKAMKREPGARYATADALAEDIERHLRGETVSAQADSAWYRLRKAVARNRLAFAAGAAVLLAVLAGSGATLLQAQRTARQALRTKAATEFVSEIFRASAHAGPRERAGPDVAPGQFLDDTARLIETRFAEQPDMQAALYGSIGRIYVDIGAGKLGVQYAMRQLKALQSSSASPELQARALMLLADANRDEGQFADAVANARDAVALLDAQTELGLEARADLATLLIYTGKRQEAQTMLAAAERTAGAGKGAATVAAAKLQFVKALMWEVDNRFDLSISVLQQAVATALAAQGPNSLLANRMRLGLARRLALAGRPAEAETVIQPALDSLAASGDAGRAQAAFEAAGYWFARHQADGKTYDEALRKIEEARATLLLWRGSLPPRALAQVEFYLASLNYQQGNVARAQALISGATPVLLASTDSPKWRPLILRTSGGIAAYSGRHAQADGLFRQALDAQQKQGFARVWGTSFIWAEAAINLMMGGDPAAAERLLAEAPAFPSQPGVAGSSANSDQNVPAARARIRLDRGDLEGALSALPKPYAQQAEREVNYLEYEPFALRGEILCAMGRSREALEMLTQTLQASQALAGPDDPSLARFRAATGLCALAAGDRPLALRLAEQARRAFDAQPEVSPWFKAPLLKLEAALPIAKRKA